jgi:hypothetical protein
MKRKSMFTGIKGLPSVIDKPTLERMKIIAHAAGITIKTNRDAQTIVYLADVFRGMIKLQRRLPK